MLIGCCCGTCGTSHNITTTAKDCGGVLLPGVVVTVTGPGGYSATCTTNGSGVCSVAWTVLGLYTISVAGGGSATLTTAVCTNYAVTVCGTGAKLVVTTGAACDGTAVPGTTYTVTQGGTTVASGSVGATGFTACVPSGVGLSVTISTTSARFTGGTFSVPAIPACTSYSASTTYPEVAMGYACVCEPSGMAICAQPVKTTLVATSSRLGLSWTITYDGVSEWNGTTTYAFPGCTSPGMPCASASVPVTLRFGKYSTGGISYRCSISLDWPIVGINGCPAATAGHGTDGAGPATFTVSSCPTSFSASASYAASATIYGSGTTCNPTTGTETITVTE